MGMGRGPTRGVEGPRGDCSSCLRFAIEIDCATRISAIRIVSMAAKLSDWRAPRMENVDEI